MTNRLDDGGTIGASNNLVILDGGTNVAAHIVAVYDGWESRRSQ